MRIEVDTREEAIEVILSILPPDITLEFCNIGIKSLCAEVTRYEPGQFSVWIEGAADTAREKGHIEPHQDTMYYNQKLYKQVAFAVLSGWHTAYGYAAPITAEQLAAEDADMEQLAREREEQTAEPDSPGGRSRRSSASGALRG